MTQPNLVQEHPKESDPIESSPKASNLIWRNPIQPETIRFDLTIKFRPTKSNPIGHNLIQLIIQFNLTKPNPVQKHPNQSDPIQSSPTIFNLTDPTKSSPTSSNLIWYNEIQTNKI